MEHIVQIRVDAVIEIKLDAGDLRSAIDKGEKISWTEIMKPGNEIADGTYKIVGVYGGTWCDD